MSYGRSYPIHHLDSTSIADDPDHSASSVDLQIGGGAMNGFGASFAETLWRRGVEDGDPARVMGYYNAADVPASASAVAVDGSTSDRTAQTTNAPAVQGAVWTNAVTNG